MLKPHDTVLGAKFGVWFLISDCLAVHMVRSKGRQQHFSGKARCILARNLLGTVGM